MALVTMTSPSAIDGATQRKLRWQEAVRAGRNHLIHFE